MSVKRLRDVLWLALKDYGHEWVMSGNFVLALAAVLAPMMVLYGLKAGIVGSMVDRLVEDLGSEPALAALTSMNGAATTTERDDGYTQDPASRWVVDAVGARPGERVLDLCAAPGGKSLLLIEEMQDEGRLVSCDVSENRVQLIRKAVERMGFAHVEPRVSDGTRPDADLPMADAILVDAPCSGLGILAKKPDIRYKTLEKARHDELLATQSAILDTAAAHLKEGGRLVYSTCTIDPAENEEQVRAFVGRHPEFRVVTPDVRFPAGMTVGDWGALSVPTRTGMDGFFLCAMQKRDS